MIGSGGEHGLGREILCSLPRSVTCRLCRGEHDCPYIVERPYGRLVVRKRAPVALAVADVVGVATGADDDPARRTPWRQRLVAALAWLATGVAVVANWVLRPVATAFVSAALAALLVTMIGTVVGVPVVRWWWRDHGGRRKGGPWRPS